MSNGKTVSYRIFRPTDDARVDMIVSELSAAAYEPTKWVVSRCTKRSRVTGNFEWCDVSFTCREANPVMSGVYDMIVRQGLAHAM